MSDNASRGVGWGSDQTGAPKADVSLIRRAQNEALEPGQTLRDLFVNPSEKGRAFLGSISSRARAALENAAREGV